MSTWAYTKEELNWMWHNLTLGIVFTTGMPSLENMLRRLYCRNWNTVDRQIHRMFMCLDKHVYKYASSNLFIKLRYMCMLCRHIFMYKDSVDSCHFISSHAISPHLISSHLISPHLIWFHHRFMSSSFHLIFSSFHLNSIQLQFICMLIPSLIDTCVPAGKYEYVHPLPYLKMLSRNNHTIGLSNGIISRCLDLCWVKKSCLNSLVLEVSHAWRVICFCY